jgi:hypothetical protein
MDEPIITNKFNYPKNKVFYIFLTYKFSLYQIQLEAQIEKAIAHLYKWKNWVSFIQ